MFGGRISAVERRRSRSDCPILAEGSRRSVGQERRRFSMLRSCLSEDERISILHFDQSSQVGRVLRQIRRSDSTTTESEREENLASNETRNFDLDSIESLRSDSRSKWEIRTNYSNQRTVGGRLGQRNSSSQRQIVETQRRIPSEEVKFLPGEFLSSSSLIVKIDL